MRDLVVLWVAGSLACCAASCADDDEGGNEATGGKRPTGGAPAGGNEPGGGTDSTNGGAGGAMAGAGGEVETVPAEGGSAGAPAAGGCGLRGASTCDPLSGAPCDLEAGETCDYIGEEGFACIPGPNDSGACGECGDDSLEFCGVGTNCNLTAQRCEKYCCADSDCDTGLCNRGVFTGDGLEDVGICSDEAEESCK